MIIDFGSREFQKMFEPTAKLMEFFNKYKKTRQSDDNRFFKEEAALKKLLLSLLAEIKLDAAEDFLSSKCDPLRSILPS